MRPLALLFLASSAALWWLSVMDRVSPIALSVVELETRLGCKLYLASAGLGLLLFLSSILRPSNRGRSVSTSRAAASSAQQESPWQSRQGSGSSQHAPDPFLPRGTSKTTAEQGEWLRDAVRQARSLRLEPGATVKLDDAANVPFALLLEGLTPERVRRAVDAFAGFLLRIPTPTRARVHFIDCLRSPVPQHRQINGLFRRHFAAGDFRVVSQESWVDVLFTHPDPRWEAYPWLAESGVFYPDSNRSIS